MTLLFFGLLFINLICVATGFAIAYYLREIYLEQVAVWQSERAVLPAEREEGEIPLESEAFFSSGEPETASVPETNIEEHGANDETGKESVEQPDAAPYNPNVIVSEMISPTAQTFEMEPGEFGVDYAGEEEEDFNTLEEQQEDPLDRVMESLGGEAFETESEVSAAPGKERYKELSGDKLGALSSLGEEILGKDFDLEAIAGPATEQERKEDLPEMRPATENAEKEEETPNVVGAEHWTPESTTEGVVDDGEAKTPAPNSLQEETASQETMSKALEDVIQKDAVEEDAPTAAESVSPPEAPSLSSPLPIDSPVRSLEESLHEATEVRDIFADWPSEFVSSTTIVPETAGGLGSTAVSVPMIRFRRKKKKNGV